MRSLTRTLIVAAAGLADVNASQAADKPVTKTAAAAPAPTLLSAAGEGRRLYMKLNCYSCHGNGAAGAMGPNIVRAEAGDVSEVLMQGADGGMPHYRAWVNATDIANIAAYLRSIGSADEPKFVEWWVAVPTR